MNFTIFNVESLDNFYDISKSFFYNIIRADFKFSRLILRFFQNSKMFNYFRISVKKWQKKKKKWKIYSADIEAFFTEYLHSKKLHIFIRKNEKVITILNPII